MQKADVVVIGGGPGGITAALTCRQHYPEKSVVLIRQEKQAVIPCGIPYIFGTVGSPEKNLIPDKLLENSGIKLVLGKVTDIDRQQKTAVTETETIAFDKLVLATGSKPARLPINGVEKENVFLIEKNVEKIRALLESVNQARNIVIIGGGFIGLELADECQKNRQVKVTVIEMLPHCLLRDFDQEFCIATEKALAEKGIEIITRTKVREILGQEKVEGILLENGKKLEAGLVILTAGFKPSINLAGKAGLELTADGFVKVDAGMKTSDENIFACGDCAGKFSFFTGRPVNAMIASVAATEGRIAGANLFSERRKNPGSIGVYSTAINGVVLAVAGLIERKAKEAGFEIITGEAEAVNRHPGGMNGAAKMKAKLVFDKNSGILIGGQVLGKESAGELINAISAWLY